MTYRIVRIHKRFFWPHPYAVEARLLWVKRVVGYKYVLTR